MKNEIKFKTLSDIAILQEYVNHCLLTINLVHFIGFIRNKKNDLLMHSLTFDIYYLYYKDLIETIYSIRKLIVRIKNIKKEKSNPILSEIYKKYQDIWDQRAILTHPSQDKFEKMIKENKSIGLKQILLCLNELLLFLNKSNKTYDWETVINFRSKENDIKMKQFMKLFN